MSGSTHIIGKQNFRFRYKGNADALAIRNQLSNMCNDELPVRLNKLFDDYDQADQVLRIDKLDIKVELTDSDNLHDALVKAILSQVEIALKSKLQEPGTSSLSFDQSFIKALNFYLFNGYLPWWISYKTSQAFLQELEIHWETPFIEKLLLLIRPALASEDARNRFNALLNKKQWLDLIEQGGSISNTEWKEWLISLQQLNTCLSPVQNTEYLERLSQLSLLELIAETVPNTIDLKSLKRIFFDKLGEKGIQPDIAALKARNANTIPQILKFALEEWAIRLSNEPSLTEKKKKVDEQLKKKAEEKKATQIPDTLGILVHNSGMVILAPFLPEFFRRQLLLENNVITDIPKALALLRHLSWGQSVGLEFELVLEKTFCGIALSETIEPLSSLNEVEINACEELLQSIIENWPVLKNTSPDGLRMNFLQREGKLEILEQQKTLIIQKEAHDILLDYISWNISMIKLPWMDQLLNIKWR